ncbi:hypothetical protein [Caulobacter phage DCM]|uniref:Uncharacterized protein n=1 Tax=Caulobacter phage DCM TaxID=3020391 RepID=A0AAE9WWI7_9CAUD|nr:hypothetical protein [Caulobacter phage DCM]
MPNTKQAAPKTEAKHGYEHFMAGSAAALDNAILSISKRSVSLDQDTHLAAVGCIGRSLPHGEGGHLDAERARRLIEAMSAGQSRNRVVAWFTHFSNIRITSTKDAETKAISYKARLVPREVKGPDGKTMIPNPDYKTGVSLEAAFKTPFWVLNEEAQVEPKSFDTLALARMLNNVVKAYAKAREEDRVVLTAVEVKLLESLEKTAKVQTGRADQMAKRAGAAVMKAAGEQHVDPLTVIDKIAATA